MSEAAWEAAYRAGLARGVGPVAHARSWPVWAEAVGVAHPGGGGLFPALSDRDVPPGIFIDEANTALDALRILEGRPDSLFGTGWFETPNGFTYLQSLIIRLLGTTFCCAQGAVGGAGRVDRAGLVGAGGSCSGRGRRSWRVSCWRPTAGTSTEPLGLERGLSAPVPGAGGAVHRARSDAGIGAIGRWPGCGWGWGCTRIWPSGAGRVGGAGLSGLSSGG